MTVGDGVNSRDYCAQSYLDWNTFLFMIAPRWQTMTLAAEVSFTEEQAARYDKVMKQTTLSR